MKSTEETYLQIDVLFSSIFGEKVNRNKISLLVREFGFEKVVDVLNYLVVNPVPPKKKKDKKYNPYGLIYYFCKHGMSPVMQRLWR